VFRVDDTGCIGYSEPFLSLPMGVPTSDHPVRARVEAAFETLTQHAFLKSTEIYRYGDTPMHTWWLDAVGMSFSRFYERHFIGAVLTYLRIAVYPVRVMPQDELSVSFQTLLGKSVPHDGKPSRYGGRDIVGVAGADGALAAELTGHWFWFAQPPGKKPGTLKEPPPLFPPVERLLEPDPPAPVVAGAPANAFVWTRRESDLNQHVTSLAFVERAENALADAGIKLPKTGVVEVWYQKPAFSGGRTEAFVEEAEGVRHVRLADAESGVTSTVLRFTQ
jgi:hypothetical protein